jgi:hypothetical protein
VNTKVISLSELCADPEGVLNRCLSTHQTIIVDLAQRGSVSIQPLDRTEDDLVDDLIEHDASFRELLAASLASPLEPFDADVPKVDPGAVRE